VELRLSRRSWHLEGHEVFGKRLFGVSSWNTLTVVGESS
jgi:hypothetical protein